jgi:hypothetical protein
MRPMLCTVHFLNRSEDYVSQILRHADTIVRIAPKYPNFNRHTHLSVFESVAA